ncbi:hypothetical protein LCAUCD174_1167 [Lacticaseibacillus paracasei]|nr:hypothetical protein LCAUCD174_1167 [Lacticaseibacillus paracasei]
MDYFELYELVLKTVNTDRPTDGFALIKDLENWNRLNEPF